MKRLVIGGLAFVLVAGAVGVIGSPATASAAVDSCDPDVTAPVVESFGPRALVVGLSKVSATFSIQAQEDCTTVAHWTVSSAGARLNVTSEAPTRFFDPVRLRNANAGIKFATITATDEAGNQGTGTSTFTLKRRTAFSGFNAGPEPVAYKGTIKLSGRLIRANWDADKYAGYAGRSVVVEKKLHGGVYTHVKTISTDDTGWARTNVTSVTKDATWRFRFAGNSISGKATSVGDSVNVLDPRFRTCRDAIDAGYGPYYKGQDPEYAWYDDRDKDGIVCE